MVYNEEVDAILRSALDSLERESAFDRRLLDGLRTLFLEGRLADEGEIRKLLVALEPGERPQ